MPLAILSASVLHTRGKSVEVPRLLMPSTWPAAFAASTSACEVTGPKSSGVTAHAMVENGLSVKPDALNVTVCPQHTVSFANASVQPGRQRENGREVAKQPPALVSVAVNGPLVFTASELPLAPSISTLSSNQVTMCSSVLFVISSSPVALL